MAPEAGAVSKGCGELTNGILCNAGPVPEEGTYTTSYMRHGVKGEITVRLGYKKTRNGYAELSKHIGLSDEGCIRGIMEYDGQRYVTKWRC